MERILVTGGAGYVGSTCCRQLVERGFSVEVLDDLSTGHADAIPEGVKLNQCDLGDRDTLISVLAGKNFDAVFHFAAKALIPESVVNPGPFFDANVGASIRMLETLRQHGIRKFVFSSSAAVYGLPKSVPIEEDHGQEPVNAYGESKLSLERILKWYAVAYGWSVVAFRYFNACGGGKTWGEHHEPETHIIPLLLETASGRRECFEIYGTDYPTPDGTCVRDYVHVLDIAEAHIVALQKMELPGFHAYNIGTGASYSVQEICRVAEEVTNKKIKIRRAARRLGDPAILCASPKKLMHEFGWTSSHSQISEIIEGAWEWEQEQCKRALAEQTF